MLPPGFMSPYAPRIPKSVLSEGLAEGTLTGVPSGGVVERGLEGLKPSEGVVERDLEGRKPSEGVKETWKVPNRRRGSLKEAWKAENRKGVFEDALNAIIL